MWILQASERLRTDKIEMTLNIPLGLKSAMSNVTGINTASVHDFSFLAPCPASGLIVHGEEDEQVPPDAIYKLVERLSIQKGVTIDIDLVPGANHFFTDHLDPMIERVSTYLDKTFNEQNFDPLA